MIYQKKSPKTQFSVLLTNDNYDRLCRLAGELSLAAAINLLIEKSYIGICKSETNSQNIGVEHHAR